MAVTGPVPWRHSLRNHTRALQANHLLDIASTNQHPVKRWFQGKLDFAPPVVNLAEQGFPLAAAGWIASTAILRPPLLCTIAAIT